jgi:DNA polymerase
MPENEQKIWRLDQKINDRGIPVNVDFVTKALSLAKRSKKEIIEAMHKLTELENANSPKQLLEWAQSEGYEGNSLRKEAVIAAIKYSETISDECRQAFEMRRAASSTTYTKLETILRQVGPDQRLRNQFVFLGSSRCGRWAGSGFQFHNMARPDKVFEDLKNVDRARHLIDQMDYDGIVREFGSVLLTVKYCIRTVFQCAA